MSTLTDQEIVEATQLEAGSAVIDVNEFDSVMNKLQKDVEQAPVIESVPASTPSIPVERQFTLDSLPEDYTKLAELKLTTEEKSFIVRNQPLGEDGKPEVYVGDWLIDKLETHELFIIKALAFTHAGRAELKREDGVTKAIVFFPSVNVIDQKRHVYKVNSVFCKFVFSIRNKELPRLTKIIISDVAWARGERTDMEHTNKFTLAHVYSNSSNKKHQDFAECCLGSSDLAMFKTSTIEKNSFSILTSAFYSAEGYAASEYADGGMYQSVGTLRQLDYMPEPTTAMIDATNTAMRNHKILTPRAEFDRLGDELTLRDQSILEGIREELNKIPEIPKVIYDASKKTYGVPSKVKVNCDAINKKKLVVLNFRGETIYYKVVPSVYDDKKEDWVVHPKLADKITHNVRESYRKLTHPILTRTFDKYENERQEYYKRLVKRIEELKIKINERERNNNNGSSETEDKTSSSTIRETSGETKGDNLTTGDVPDQLPVEKVSL